MATAQQKNHFDTFGFLVLRQAFSPQETEEIDRAFEEVIEQEMQQRGAGPDPAALEGKFVIDPGFCERNETLARLPDDPRIGGTAEQLLGEGCYYIGSDGSLRVGDTLWHPDQGWDPSIPRGLDDPNYDTTRGHYCAGIKTGIYLDPVDGDTGCLSVIPGSHISPFHEALGSLHCDIPERGRHLLDDPQIRQFDFAGNAVPHYAIDSQPGDVVFFSNMLWHAAFGGRTGRRMFAISFKGPPTNEGERQQADSRKRTVQKMRETAGRG